MDVDGAVLGLLLELNVERAILAAAGQHLGAVEREDVLGDHLLFLEAEVQLVNAEVATSRTHTVTR